MHLLRLTLQVRLGFAAATLSSAAWTVPALAGHIDLTDDARRLHADSLLVDGHNDLPWALRQNGDSSLTRFDLRRRLTRFHTDIPRLREGGMGAQFWSVYVPANDRTPYRKTLEQIDLVNRMVAKYSDAFARANGTADIRSAHGQGLIASLIGVEGGHCIENSLDKLRDLYERGARYMTLTHSKTTSWADSATDTERHGGLTEFGREVVREMNRLGMLVDISHVSAKAMRDTILTSRAPVIASHSSAYTITPHPRNVPDDVLRMVKENGGVVMVNFYSAYIRRGNSPTDVDTLLDHIDHIVKIAGIDHVGIGSDYDGVPTLPRQLESVASYPYITQGLINRGYSETDIRKILGENLMRAFAEVEATAKRL